MISVVKSVDAYHDDYVKEDVRRIQAQGYEVFEIKRTERMRFGIFGNDVTEIHYKQKT